MTTEVMTHEQLDSMAAVASKTTWAGAWVAGIFGGLSINEAVAVGGFVLAVIGFAANLYFRRRADQRAERLFALREQRLLSGRSDHMPIEDHEGGA